MAALKIDHVNCEGEADDRDAERLSDDVIAHVNACLGGLDRKQALHHPE